MNFYMTATPKNYSLFYQDIELKPLDDIYDGLKATYFINDDNAFTIAGKIKLAKISDFNIFPNFQTWYIENIYLIPLTLVSAIFGGIALFQKKNKKD